MCLRTCVEYIYRLGLLEKDVWKLFWENKIHILQHKQMLLHIKMLIGICSVMKSSFWHKNQLIYHAAYVMYMSRILTWVFLCANKMRERDRHTLQSACGTVSVQCSSLKAGGALGQGYRWDVVRLQLIPVRLIVQQCCFQFYEDLHKHLCHIHIHTYNIHIQFIHVNESLNVRWFV